MSVPPDRMAVRQGGDPNKIMGVKKPVFWVIIALGLVLAFYIWRRTKNSGSDLQSANAGTQPDTNGVTAADIGGTPADNSFATNTDLTAIEQQIQQLEQSLFQLQQSNGGNGAGLPGGDVGGLSTTPNTGTNTTGGFTEPGGNPGPVIGDGSGVNTPSGTPTGTSTPIPGIGTEPIHYFGPGGAGIYTPPPVTTTPQTSSGFVEPARTVVPGTFQAV